MNEIEELRHGRLSSLSGKNTSRSSITSSLQSYHLHLLRLLQLLQQTCPVLCQQPAWNESVLVYENTTFIVMGASSPCNGNHFLVIV